MITADRGDAGRRIDLVLRRRLLDVSAATRTRVQAWIEDGLVCVNGLVVRKVSTRAALGDCLTVALPESTARAVMRAEPIALDVLYEDDHLLAVNKPAGMVVHPTYGHAAQTLMNALLWHGRQWPSAQRPSIVGRLDKFTSGLVVVAKTGPVHAALQRALRAASAEKDYLALVYGRVPEAPGTIAWCLGRDPRDRRRIVASATDGAESLTRYARIAYSDSAGTELSFVRCRLVTGRTHQIRVHLAASGWPIVGDPTYGARQTRVDHRVVSPLVQAFPRQALHAWRVVVPHVATGKSLVLEAPLPEDLLLLLNEAVGIDASSRGDRVPSGPGGSLSR